VSEPPGTGVRGALHILARLAQPHGEGGDGLLELTGARAVLGSLARTSALGCVELPTQSLELVLAALELAAKALKVLITRAELDPRPLARSIELDLNPLMLERDDLQLGRGLREFGLNPFKLNLRLLASSLELELCLRAQVLDAGGAIAAQALELGGALGTRALELAARGARLTHELLGEAGHLPPGGALLTIADAQLAQQMAHAPVRRGGRLIDLYDRARAGDVLAHDRDECKGAATCANP
jgi:hypothetical protein